MIQIHEHQTYVISLPKCFYKGPWGALTKISGLQPTFRLSSRLFCDIWNGRCFDEKSKIIDLSLCEITNWEKLADIPKVLPHDLTHCGFEHLLIFAYYAYGLRNVEQGKIVVALRDNPHFADVRASQHFVEDEDLHNLTPVVYLENDKKVTHLMTETELQRNKSRLQFLLIPKYFAELSLIHPRDENDEDIHGILWSRSILNGTKR
jgi:hypothetical protein